MTREEALKILQREKDCVQQAIQTAVDGQGYVSPDGMIRAEDYVEACAAALSALRPVRREQVEKAWFREPYTRLETRSTPEGNRQYIAENICMACGNKTPIGRFCHNCGVALDDWAVEMVMERLEALWCE